LIFAPEHLVPKSLLHWVSMFCWNVEPCALSVPLAHAGALPAAAGALDAPVEAAAVVAGAAGAELAADGDGAALVGELDVLLLLLQAAAANNTPAVSRDAAMRVVLTR
jgi:hypothetical protein